MASVRSAVTRLREYSYTVTHTDFMEAVAREFASRHHTAARRGATTTIHDHDHDHDRDDALGKVRTDCLKASVRPARNSREPFVPPPPQIPLPDVNAFPPSYPNTPTPLRLLPTAP